MYTVLLSTRCEYDGLDLLGCTGDIEDFEEVPDRSAVDVPSKFLLLRALLQVGYQEFDALQSLRHLFCISCHVNGVMLDNGRISLPDFWTKRALSPIASDPCPGRVLSRDLKCLER